MLDRASVCLPYQCSRATYAKGQKSRQADGDRDKELELCVFASWFEVEVAFALVILGRIAITEDVHGCGNQNGFRTGVCRAVLSTSRSRCRLKLVLLRGPRSRPLAAKTVSTMRGDVSPQAPATGTCLAIAEPSSRQVATQPHVASSLLASHSPEFTEGSKILQMRDHLLRLQTSEAGMVLVQIFTRFNP